jgi:hypothetical protein
VAIYAYTQENSEFFKGLNYNKLKKSILSAINAEKKLTKPNKEVRRLFPNVIMSVNAIKKESKIFVEVYKEIPNEKIALIIHDCILIIEKDILLVKNLLKNRGRKLFSCVILEHHNLDKLFKTSLVPIPNHMLEKTQRDAYMFVP